MPLGTVIAWTRDTALIAILSEFNATTGNGVCVTRTFEESMDQCLTNRRDDSCVLVDLDVASDHASSVLQGFADAGISLPMVFCQAAATIYHAVDAMQAGASALLPKPASSPHLQRYLSRAIDQAIAAKAQLRRQSAATQRLAELTSKERQVLEAILAGKTNRQLAEELGLTTRAIEDRRSRLMRRLEVKSLVELVDIVRAAELLARS